MIAPMPEADREAHEKASRRRPALVTQESPIPPAAPAARRRFIAQRGW